MPKKSFEKEFFPSKAKETSMHVYRFAQILLWDVTHMSMYMYAMALKWICII